MGNDMVSIFIERKKAFTIRLSLLFMKYLVDEKVRLQKTIDKITNLYFDQFHSSEDLSYFSLQNSKDNLLKKSLLSVLSFYQENHMEEQIEKDIKPVILLSNLLYLSLSLEEYLDHHYGDKDNSYLTSFFKKYQNKLGSCKEEKKESLKKELSLLLKKEEAVYQKFFKALADSQYRIQLNPLLDYPNGYLVIGEYEIKMLSRYSPKEVHQVYQKKEIYGNHFLITLERLSMHYLQHDFLRKENNQYFLPVFRELLEKDSYYQSVKKILQNEGFRKRCVFLFSYKEVKRHKKILEKMKSDHFSIGLKNIEGELEEEILSQASYLLIDSSFLESHSSYSHFLDEQKIRFILWEEGEE